MVKICTKCEIEKKIDDFSNKKSSKDGKHTICKECTRQYTKQHYKDNKDYYKKKGKVARAKLKKENREFVYNYLLNNPCVDCNESNLIVLDFDHIKDKKFNVSEMVSTKSLDLIKEEISKCEVRCANCHRIKTAKQLGWYRWTKNIT